MESWTKITLLETIKQLNHMFQFILFEWGVINGLRDVYDAWSWDVLKVVDTLDMYHLLIVEVWQINDIRPCSRRIVELFDDDIPTKGFGGGVVVESDCQEF